MKKYLLVLAAMAMGAVACTSDPEAVEGTVPAGSDNNAANSNLTTVQLASFASSQTRVVMAPGSRADYEPQPGSLELIATIENLSKEEGRISGFTKEGENGRYLSATCVYYDPATETYYATYHMQGNNYNTTQTNDTAGFIETFKLQYDESEGVYKPVLGKVYTAANPAELSFDFNHLYFDQIPNVSEVTPGGMKLDYVGTYDADDFKGNRLIAVGHKSEPSSKEGGQPNTAAIIARLDLDAATPTMTYETVFTGDKIYDENIKKHDGTLMPLGDEDAGDVNCVVRKYNHYYLATRKGVAVLKAGEETLFRPEVDATGHNYFMRTPGSAKFLSQPLTTSYVYVLYLQNDTPEGGLTATTASPANFAQLACDTRDKKDCPQDIPDLTNFSWETSLVFPNAMLKKGIESVTPVDGKNVAISTRNITCIALGKGGLYIDYPSYHSDKIVTFSDIKENDKLGREGSRSVNGLFAEEVETYNGKTLNNGFIYVANGACLTIIDAQTLKTVAEYSAFDSTEGAENLASANYVYVTHTNTKTNGQTDDRIITVAYGQAGVKAFRFVPPTK